MNTEITNAVNAAGDKAQYDARVKRILAQKNILAHILVKTVDEFKGMKPEDVVTYIEGEPKVGIVPVEPGLSNIEKTDATGQRIVGLNTENAEINEGLVRFDIIFYVRMKNGLSQIIVNVEAQKDEPTEYKILNRAIFYVSRLVSSQKERDFVNTNYDDIKQVFSIWICMNMDYNSLSHIHLAKDEMLSPYDWKGNMDLLNIVLVGITNDIPEHDENYEMHRLIGALLSTELREQEKRKSGYEGVVYKNVIGTYLHGPLLPKNPQVSDYLIARALERKYGDDSLIPLDDSQEISANQYIYDRFVKKADADS